MRRFLTSPAPTWLLLLVAGLLLADPCTYVRAKIDRQQGAESSGGRGL